MNDQGIIKTRTPGQPTGLRDIRPFAFLLDGTGRQDFLVVGNGFVTRTLILGHWSFHIIHQQLAKLLRLHPI